MAAYSLVSGSNFRVSTADPTIAIGAGAWNGVTAALGAVAVGSLAVATSTGVAVGQGASAGISAVAVGRGTAPSSSLNLGTDACTSSGAAVITNAAGSVVEYGTHLRRYDAGYIAQDERNAATYVFVVPATAFVQGHFTLRNFDYSQFDTGVIQLPAAANITPLVPNLAANTCWMFALTIQDAWWDYGFEAGTGTTIQFASDYVYSTNVIRTLRFFVHYDGANYNIYGTV